MPLEPYLPVSKPIHFFVSMSRRWVNAAVDGCTTDADSDHFLVDKEANTMSIVLPSVPECMTSICFCLRLSYLTSSSPTMSLVQL